jgi:acetyl-CoA acetyltransferase
MGCCGNNSNCKRNTDNFKTTQEPVEKLLDIREIVNMLGVMAVTGVKHFKFSDENLDELAIAVTKLAAENTYLKKLAALISPAGLDITEEEVRVTFGPGNAYTLTLPVMTESQRKLLGEQFLAIANKLGAHNETPDKQLNLF